MKSLFERTIGIFYIIALIGLIILGILTFLVNKTVKDTDRWVLHTQGVLIKTEQVSFSVKEFEYGIQQAELSALVSHPGVISLSQTLLSRIEALQNLTRDNNNQQLKIKKLADLVKLRVRTTKVNNKTTPEAKESFSLTSEHLIDRIRKEENKLLATRIKANNSSRETLNILFYSILLAGVMLLIASYITAKKYFGLKKESDIKILEMNQNLEKWVEEKANQLLEKEKQYQLVLDNLLEGAQIIDREWRYVYVNDSLTKQARFAAQEMLGSKMTDLFPGINETQLFKELSNVMESRLPTRFENSFQYPNGDIAHYELSIEPVQEGLFVLSMDITDRKIKELYKEQYIAELEEVLFKISHEVRSPVVKILGVSQLMDLSLIEEKELPMIMDSMKSCALLLDRYTRELSDFVYEMKKNSTDH